MASKSKLNLILYTILYYNYFKDELIRMIEKCEENNK